MYRLLTREMFHSRTNDKDSPDPVTNDANNIAQAIQVLVGCPLLYRTWHIPFVQRRLESTGANSNDAHSWSVVVSSTHAARIRCRGTRL